MSTKQTTKTVKASSTPVKKTFAERFSTFKKESPGMSGKETKVNIMKVLNEDGDLVAVAINGFYGAKDYFMNVMNCANILIYLERLNTYVDKQKITNISDTKYAALDSATPTVIMSAYPVVDNTELKDSFPNVYQHFLTYFEQNGDPINKCSVKFNHLDDFMLDNDDKVNNFFFLGQYSNFMK